MITSPENAMYSLADLELSHAMLIGAAMRRLGQGAETLESVAQTAARFFCDQLRDEQGERSACVLARCFKTHRYGLLPPELKVAAEAELPGQVLDPQTRAVALLGTWGDLPAWCARRESVGRQAIPIIDARMLDRMPMLRELFRASGLDWSSFVRGESSTPRKGFEVFLVADADGSPIIPAQEQFVRSHGVKSAVGFSFLLPTQEIFAVVLFTRVRVDAGIADLFQTLALSLKLAVLPLVSAPTFEGMGPDPALDVQDKILSAQNATLQELLAVHEEQARTHLELIGAQKRALDQRAREAAAANKALERINAEQNLVLESSTLGIALVRKRHFQWANRRLEELLGIPLARIQGASTRILYPSYEVYEELSRAAYALLAQGLRSEHTLQLRRRDGTLFWCRFIGKALDSADPEAGSIWMFEDITEAKRAEQERQMMEVQLRQAQKLESVGRLAAGVAHEINTPIQFVSDNVHFVKGAVGDLEGLLDHCRSLALRSGENAATQLAAAEEAADLSFLRENIPKALESSLEGLSRVATIVGSMKEFAHPDQKEMAPVDLNQAIRSTLTIAHNEYKYVADVDTDFGELPLVVCHGGEVNQAVLNIVVNAAHAVADVVQGTDNKGRIGLATRREGESVVVRISDTGTGIPEGIRDQVFDPFFTTKEVGRGTGQGLSIARSIIADKHGGELTFETEVGKGTTFIIRLPLEGRKAAPAPALR
ncbi:MAG: PAS domain S-box protein [Deltaproteobacteria bacterium]|nr:PAS domain S-box protein [Deltaproteobacteria bacterium]